MIHRSCILLLVVIISPLVLKAEDQPKEWLAGSARINITPQKMIWMSGYGGRDHPAESKLTELWAKAIAIQDADGNRGVMITLDLVGIHRDTAAKICDLLNQHHQLARNQIAINCSHTHTGPVVGHNLGPLHYYRIPSEQQALVDQYENELVANIVSVVSDALKAMEPCALSWGSGYCSVAVNRRNNNQSKVPETRLRGELKGPFDHDVPVLLVRRIKDQSLQAVVFGYACHATVLSIYQWSGDYPGYAQIQVETLYPGVNAMFWAGCGADQNPLPRRSVDLARQYGNRLGNAVAEVIEGTVRPLTPSLKTKYSEIALPIEQLPSVSQLEKLIAQESSYEQARARYLLDRLGDRKQLQPTYLFPISHWQFGNTVDFVFLGGEVVVDYALALKSRVENHKRTAVWVAGYSNDVMAYIPSRRVLAEGGYEGGGSDVYYGLPGLWSPKIENMILNEIELSDEQVSGKQ